MCRARPGNYLAFFPSYAYLKLVGAHVSRAGSGITLKAQLPGMGEAERGAFLDAFRRRRPGTLLGLVVMGGVFAEGVDLPGNMLSGAAVVGVGFPRLSLERAALSAALEEEGEPGDGMMGAYLYPGMERVLQAAGRVIRTETDRGVVLLIDERYRQPVYEELLPPHWRVQDAGDLGQLGNKLEQFWG
jgi:Rad3-related DNA helicase